MSQPTTSRGKKILFIDRDGTLIKEAPPTYQLDSFDKLEFYPGMFNWMRKIALELEFELIMVTNQDGLGSPSFPENSFLAVHEFVMRSLENEDIHFPPYILTGVFLMINPPTANRVQACWRLISITPTMIFPVHL